MGIENAPVAGVWTTQDLAAVGWGNSQIRRAVAEGRLRRLRRGWFCQGDTPDEVVRAVSAGGVLACASALSLSGAWDATAGLLHVRTDRNVSASLPVGMTRCQPASGREPAPVQAVDAMPIALRSAFRCLDREAFVAVCDSMLVGHLATMDDLHLALSGVPGRDAVLERCAWADSGTESLVRQRLRGRGIHVQAQVVIAGVGRVDLLVGERLVIEVDSRRHHTGVDNYRNDRRRDLALRALGYIVVRLTYEQVVHQWPETEQSILAMVRRGDHWWGARRGTRSPR